VVVEQHINEKTYMSDVLRY